MREIVFKHALLDGNLRAHIEVLHRATAAGAKELTLRLGADHAFTQHIDHFRLFETWLATVAQIGDALAGQCALDENHLAWGAVFVDGATYAARFHVERFDFQNWGYNRRAGHGGCTRLGGRFFLASG